MSFSSELHFQMNNGAKGSRPLLLKKEEIHSGYAAMQEKLCEALKAIQSAHTMGEIILSLELHSTYVHSRALSNLYIFLFAYYSIAFYSFSLCQSAKEIVK
jgi:hypothetical protein